METSAKDASNVEQAFMNMAAEIKNRCVFFSPPTLWGFLYCFLAVEALFSSIVVHEEYILPSLL